VKIYAVPLDERWLERIRKEADLLREKQRELLRLPIACGDDTVQKIAKLMSFCAGELETIRWSAFNRDVVVTEGNPLWHEKEDDLGKPTCKPLEYYGL
jgi:hypothetical protein